MAIVGLIMLIVFLAIPSLQRSVRNSRRRSDLGKFYAAVGEHQTARNKGSTAPFTGPNGAAEFTEFKQKFLGPEFDVYTSSGPDGIQANGGGGSHHIEVEVDQIVYYPWHYCADGVSMEGSEIETVTSPGPHDHGTFSVLIGMENGYNYCLDVSQR